MEKFEFKMASFTFFMFHADGNLYMFRLSMIFAELNLISLFYLNLISIGYV